LNINCPKFEINLISAVIRRHAMMLSHLFTDIYRSRDLLLFCLLLVSQLACVRQGGSHGTADKCNVVDTCFI